MTEAAEQLLKDRIFPELERGRADWDRPHTEAVVFYMKEILLRTPESGLDGDVLVIAAYAHDWGYADLFSADNPADWQNVMKMKPLHMEIGARKLQELLGEPQFDFLSPERKSRAVHLVAVHDALDRITEPDERVLVEADTLGGLDSDKTRSTFGPEDLKRYVRGVRAKRLPLFLTEYGRRQAEKLLRDREAGLELNR